MKNTNKDIKAKFQKLEDEKELSKISGGRKIYGVSLYGLLPNDEFKKYLSNPNGYSLASDKWILIDENNYTVIGEYENKDEMNNAANEMQSKDSNVEYRPWWVWGEYGMLEFIRLQKGLPGYHYW